MMTYDELLTRIIDDGLAEIRDAYAANDPKRIGAEIGFEACRGRRPGEMIALYQSYEKRRHAITQNPQSDSNDYWAMRYAALQIEWCLNVISVGLRMPLLPHLPTARGVRKYADIVGVTGLPDARAH